MEDTLEAPTPLIEALIGLLCRLTDELDVALLTSRASEIAALLEKGLHFASFATVPLQDPKAGADEFELGHMGETLPLICFNQRHRPKALRPMRLFGGRRSRERVGDVQSLHAEFGEEFSATRLAYVRRLSVVRRNDPALRLRSSQGYDPLKPGLAVEV